MGNYLRVAFATAFLVGAQCVYAGGTGSGKVEIEHVGFGTGLVFFYTTNHADGPACNNFRKRWVLTTTTPEGKGQYTFLLAAEATGKEVKVWGTSTCDLYGNSES